MNKHFKAQKGEQQLKQRKKNRHEIHSENEKNSDKRKMLEAFVLLA